VEGSIHRLMKVLSRDVHRGHSAIWRLDASVVELSAGGNFIVEGKKMGALFPSKTLASPRCHNLTDSMNGV
jgi:hypothetical protein